MERKEAIEVIKKNYPDSSSTKLREALETLIPELKESEDESIRKGIIEYLEQSQFGEEHYQIDDDIVRNYIAWLEKQKPVEHFELKAGRWYFCHQAFCCRADDLTVKEGERFMCEEDGVVKGFVIKHPEKYFVEINAPESQDEKQKPVDKVEPKFKVGDWVVGEENTCKIVDVIRSFYKLCFQDGKTVNVDIPYVDEKFHLWTIQDAKLGDVLATDWKDEDEQKWQKIVIFESLSEFGVEGYGNTFVNNKLAFKDAISFYSKTWTKYLYPATKEQRYLLFEKMKEAGYKWDAEKKKLKKIEKKHLDKVEKGKWYVCIKDLFDNYANKAFCEGEIYLCTQDGRLIPSNSNVPYEVVCPVTYFREWTIQDAKDGDILCCESGWTCIFKALDNYTNTFSSYCFMDSDKWFCDMGSECHTLKEEFVKAYNGKIYPATKEQRDQLFSKMREAGYEWDAEKKELIKIENVSAWNEEDENNLEYIESILCCPKSIPIDKYKSLINWLKSFKQKHWKPSEEQMQTLHAQLNEGAVTYPEDKRVLTTLYENLMKIN